MVNIDGTAALLLYCKYLVDGGGAPPPRPPPPGGSCFDELISEAVLLRASFINPSALRSAALLYVPSTQRLKQSRRTQTWGNKTLRAPSPPRSILMAPTRFDRMDEVTGFLSGSPHAHKSPFSERRRR